LRLPIRTVAAIRDLAIGVASGAGGHGLRGAAGRLPSASMPTRTGARIGFGECSALAIAPAWPLRARMNALIGLCVASGAEGRLSAKVY
jgi:hypothetical protein